jgi:hypothetical protein
MTTTFVSADSIGTGTRFTFTASGDALVVLPGVTLGSTNGLAVSNGSFSDLDVTVLGTLSSVSQLSLTANSSFVVGVGGTFASYQPSALSAGLFVVGANSVVRIEGTVTAQEAVAILTTGGSNSVFVSGSVSGASAVFLGLTGSPGDVLVNAGRIASNAFDDALNNTRINNAVFTEGQNTRITNLAGGVITATSSEGNGVRLGAGSNGSTVTNHGMILSTAAAGVDLSGIGVGETGTLVNSGQVQGFGNALMAQAAAGVLRRGAGAGQRRVRRARRAGRRRLVGQRRQRHLRRARRDRDHRRHLGRSGQRHPDGRRRRRDAGGRRRHGPCFRRWRQ